MQRADLINTIEESITYVSTREGEPIRANGTGFVPSRKDDDDDDESDDDCSKHLLIA